MVATEPKTFATWTVVKHVSGETNSSFHMFVSHCKIDWFCCHMWLLRMDGMDQ